MSERIEHRGMVVIPNPEHGDVIDATDTFYPSVLRCVGRPGFAEESKFDTTFGYVLRGSLLVTAPKLAVTADKGAYFSIAGNFLIEPKYASKDDPLVVLIKRFGYRGQTMFGTVEKHGRLSYIDGCSDSLLVYPPRLGDPCLNHLHFPPGILQTQHTHPTVRMGIVSNGKGKAFRVPSAGNTGWESDLSEGCVFLLNEQEQHSFRTSETDSVMDVIAYHPDSDFGPTDADHPMINRTYVGNQKGV